jgi:hypothetical protein
LRSEVTRAFQPTARAVDAEGDHFVAQRIADRDDGVGPVRGPQDHLARQPVLRQQRDVRAARADHQRLVEVARQHGGGDAVRIKIVGVDQVEVEAFVDQAADRRLGGLRQQQGGDVHADLRQHRITRMADRDPVAHFVARGARHLRIAAEARVGRREPGHRRHHARLDPAAGHQVAQAGLDEDPVSRLFPVRKQGAERQNLHAAALAVRRP